MAGRRVNDALQWYMSEVSSRVVAETGIPSDRFHLGKIILQCLRDYPEAVLQIDAATGESDTNASMLEKSVKCATCFRSLDLVPGDVIVLMAPNHIALSVPFYAALYTGVIIAVVDRMLEVRELQDTFNINEPKIIFCQSEKAPDIQVALNEIDHTATIVTFDKGDYLCDLTEFIEKFAYEIPIEEFKATDFDAENSTAVLISTSGTTGMPKAAEVTYKNFAIAAPLFWSRYTTFPGPISMTLVGSPLQWLTAIATFIASPILKITRLQSSIPLTREYTYDLINTYKPNFTVFSPTFMATLIKEEVGKNCDFSCFDTIILGGSAVPLELIEDIRNITPNTDVLNAYGMSETAGIAFCGDMSVPASCGQRLNCYEYRLIDIDTQEDICDPNVQGELWIRGPSVFKGYYKNSAATEATFADGEWLKTGDMFYRDENWYFYFVERIKLLLKYKSNQISPVEIENVIRQHPGVQDVAVTGIEDPECGDLPVACVVIREGHEVTADEIKQLVKDNLSDSKQLRGGVIFLNSIPLTASTKIHRRMLKDIANNFERQ
ncbi:luciferin 4-monooxygenase-like [Melitaea cinxia]|uniref:luciferin 4-monooxygenase-like n=1 Tax=Melitaea cinxia TaxID=113334 RepID=UPI001E271BBB|nr:luciferin 4-monooxygenase-like [Melitaea cinxia]